MSKFTRILGLSLLALLTLPIAAFHGFVGWHKAFSPYALLVQHSAWTIHLPMWLGRLIGWLELTLTGGLLAALLRPSLAIVGVWICGALVVLELVSALTHWLTRDGGSLTQNAVSIALTLALALLYSWRARLAESTRRG